MLSAVKFIPRDQLSKPEYHSDSDSCREIKKKHGRKDKSRSKRKKHRYSDSSDEDEERGLSKRKAKKKSKWYSSGGSSTSSETEDESSSDSRRGKHKRRRKKNEKSKRDRRKSSSKRSEDTSSSEEIDKAEPSRNDIEIARREMGLEWMLKPSDRPRVQQVAQDAPSDDLEEEKPKLNPKELNPYLKDGGEGYPKNDEADEQKRGASQLPPPPVVGDGGASWRLKALKRAQEQAAREGRKLDEVVEERWGSLGKMAASVATTRAAPARAHLHAIRDRKRDQKGGTELGGNGDNDSQIERDDQRIKNNRREYLKNVSSHDSRMKAPKIRDSLSWRNKKNDHTVRPEDAEHIRTAASSLNKYENDGSFFREFAKHQNKEQKNSSLSADFENERDLGDGSQSVSDKDEKSLSDASYQQSLRESDSCKGDVTTIDHRENEQGLSANQLAAKAMQLRLKGKHDEADDLLKESQKMLDSQKYAEEKSNKKAAHNRFDSENFSARMKQRAEDDADAHLASKIMRSKQYSTATQADDEYDFDDIPDTRKRQTNKTISKSQTGKMNVQKRIITQQERCQLCFDNPSRPKHLIISIANFTYLMLPPWEPVVQGHCYILPMQHESSTRNLDDNVWEELRNFKKCLLRMYAEHDKDLLFLETAIGFAQQQRHCLVECIPLPHDIAKEAPLYFKKAIDEAEEEWSQHNAKKLIDTSIKGLRGSIPKNFPYFHVEFGLHKGFVHVIDDEKNFKSHFGLNVIRGMLQLPEEDMYRRRKQGSFELQKKAALEFARKWEPFDWTKMLD